MSYDLELNEDQDLMLNVHPVQHTYPKISVFGEGKCINTTATCLANAGFRVAVTNSIYSESSSKDIEPSLADLAAQNLDNGNLLLSDDAVDMIAHSDMSIVSLPLPEMRDGALNLVPLLEVLTDVGLALKEKFSFHVIVLRTSLPPGTTRSKLIPFLEEKSGLMCGRDFGVCVVPDFLDRDNLVASFYNPNKLIIGSFSIMSMRPLEEVFEKMGLQAEHTSLEIAEMVKYVDSGYAALKQSFANEIGRLCQSFDLDSHKIFELIAPATGEQLNQQPKSGPPLSGHNLMRELEALSELAETNKVTSPLLQNIIASNNGQIEHTLNMVQNATSDNSTIGFMGISACDEAGHFFDNPVLQIMAKLYLAGHSIRFYDPNMKSAEQAMASAPFIEDTAISSFLKDLDQFQCAHPQDLLDQADTLIVARKTALFRQLIRRRTSKQTVIDLVRLFERTDNWSTIRKSGVDDFVSKPATKDILRTAIEKWCAHTSTPHILIAEDEEPVANVTALMLETLGCKVKIVSNGLDAYNQAKETEFDMVLMDLSMPLKSGLEASEMIRSLPDQKSRVPILAYSNYAAPEKSVTYAGVGW